MKLYELFESTDKVKQKAWFSHDRKAWEKAVAKLHVDDDGRDFAKCDGKLIAKWYEDRDEGWVLVEDRQKKHYIVSNGSRIAGPFDSEDEADAYLMKLMRRATPEDELDDAHIVLETKNHMGETEYSSWSSWRAAVKKHFPDFWIDGDKEIANAMIGPKPFKKGETKSVGEWDGEKGVIYAHTMKG